MRKFAIKREKKPHQQQRTQEMTQSPWPSSEQPKSHRLGAHRAGVAFFSTPAAPRCPPQRKPWAEGGRSLRPPMKSPRSFSPGLGGVAFKHQHLSFPGCSNSSLLVNYLQKPSQFLAGLQSTSQITAIVPSPKGGSGQVQLPSSAPVCRIQAKCPLPGI